MSIGHTMGLRQASNALSLRSGPRNLISLSLFLSLSLPPSHTYSHSLSLTPSFLFYFLIFIFKRFYLFIFREQAMEEEREKQQCVRDTSISCLSHAPLLGTWLTAQAYALTRNRTSDLLVCRPALSPLSHTS